MKFRQVATNRSQRWRDHKSLPPDIPQRFTFIVRCGSVAAWLKALVLAHSTEGDGDIIIFIKQQNELPLRFQTPAAAGSARFNRATVSLQAESQTCRTISQTVRDGRQEPFTR
jgi:hypothetical protein